MKTLIFLLTLALVGCGKVAIEFPCNFRVTADDDHCQGSERFCFESQADETSYMRAISNRLGTDETRAAIAAAKTDAEIYTIFRPIFDKNSAPQSCEAQ